jgi:hypothetical protein
MTDMRATERLLEFIGEQTDDPKILDALAELRRRGDTLVGGRDLELLLQVIGREHLPLGDDEVKALARSTTHSEEYSDRAPRRRHYALSDGRLGAPRKLELCGDAAQSLVDATREEAERRHDRNRDDCEHDGVLGHRLSCLVLSQTDQHAL